MNKMENRTQIGFRAYDLSQHFDSNPDQPVRKFCMMMPYAFKTLKLGVDAQGRACLWVTEMTNAPDGPDLVSFVAYLVGADPIDCADLQSVNKFIDVLNYKGREWAVFIGPTQKDLDEKAFQAQILKLLFGVE